MSGATKRVSGKVTNLTAIRDGDAIKVEWRNPASMFDESRPDHATWLDSVIEFVGGGKTSGQVWDPDGDMPAGARDLSYTGYDAYWVKGLGTKTSYTKPYSWSSYHPVSPGRYLSRVNVSVHGGNDSGVGGGDPDDRNASGRGPDAAFTYYFWPPRAPELSGPALDQKTGVLSCKVRTDAGTDAYARRDTMHRIVRKDNYSPGYRALAPVSGWTWTEATEADLSLDVTEFQSLPEGQWALVRFEAYARGPAGDSATVAAQHMFAWPAQAVIRSVKCSSMQAGGVVTVAVDTRSSEYEPVDSITLQRAHSATAETVAQARLIGGWADVSDATDNGASSGLSDNFSDAIPTSGGAWAEGVHTWYRVKSSHDNYTRYSEPFEAKDLYRPVRTAAGSAVEITSVRSGGAGDSVIVTLGWDDDMTGTELSWSTLPDAWRSNEPPETALVDWSDGAAGGHSGTAEFTIYGVEEGTPLYIRARRYLVNGGETTYGDYCEPATALYPFTPASAPSAVHLSAPPVVARGADVELSWTFESGSAQVGWVVYRHGGSRTVLASGDDSLGACSLPGPLLGPLLGDLDGAVLSVAVTTGGEWVESPAVTVAFADPPALSASVPATLAAQPLSISAASATGNDLLSVEVVARGITMEGPAGAERQLPGDAVWSAVTMPAWEASGGSYAAAVSLPAGLPFHDLGSYEVRLRAIDADTGLESAERAFPLSVAWAHKAAAPSASVEAVREGRQARISVSAPEGAAEGDVLDVYRVTPDGADLVASGLPSGSKAVDRFAPFGRGELAYRVACRTADGDVEWADFPYEMGGPGIRLDWGAESVELPYNVSLGSGWKKDFTRRAHLDGSRSGHWGPGADRDATMSSWLVKLGSPAEQEALRSLARTAAPVFVRTSDGCAYEANVDVGDFPESYDSGAVAVTLNAQAVDLSDAFRIAANDVDYGG